MRILPALALLSVIAITSTSTTAQERSCIERLRELGPLAMRMPYQEFDQSPEGWRKIADCQKEAQVLLERYVKKQEDELRRTRWHYGQMMAMNGDNAKAAEIMLLAVNPPEIETSSKFSWNTYALATIAFLRGDRVAFDLQYAEHRRRAQADAANNTNLTVLDRLSRCFGKTYAAAYTCEA